MLKLNDASARSADDWQADPDVRSTVNFAAAPETVPDAGETKIKSLAAGSSGDRGARLELVAAGLVDRSNQLRAIVREGILGKVEQSKLLSDQYAAARQALAGLPADASANQRHDLEVDSRAKGHAMGENAEDAELLCHRYGYIERKAQRLVDVVGAEIKKN